MLQRAQLRPSFSVETCVQSSNRGVLRYFIPESGSTATTVFPSPSSFAFFRATEGDIDAAAESGAQGIIVCFSVSQFHRENKFRGMTKDEYLERLSHWISYAEDKGLFVIYSGEDTSRERDLGFLREAYRTAEESGADGARIIDTLGCLSPDGAAYLVREIGRAVDIPLEDGGYIPEYYETLR